MLLVYLSLSSGTKKLYHDNYSKKPDSYTHVCIYNNILNFVIR